MTVEKCLDAVPSSTSTSDSFSQSSVEKSIPDVLDSHHLDCLEDELLTSSCEVIPSLSVCANIHQAQYFPFWEDVLKCSS